MSNAKAVGPSELPVKLHRLRLNPDPTVVLKFHRMIMLVWNQWKAPQRWRDAVTNVVHEDKDRNECGSYRVIPIVAHAGNVILKIVTTRLSAYYEAKERLPEEQCGFRPHCSTIDMMFMVRRLHGLGGKRAYHFPGLH